MNLFGFDGWARPAADLSTWLEILGDSPLFFDRCTGCIGVNLISGDGGKSVILEFFDDSFGILAGRRKSVSRSVNSTNTNRVKQ